MRKIYTFTTVFLLCCGWSVAQETRQPDFERGYYLETHEHDFEAAADAYERVISSGSASDDVRAEARERLAGCKEEAAAADFARLMPPNSVAYVETSNPGKHLSKLVSLLGLTDPSDATGFIEIDDGFGLPLDLKASPALLRELGKVRGAAVAFTSFDLDHEDVPPGILVINMGDSDLVRGLIETGIQFIRPAEPIAGFKTYNIEGEAWVTTTNRLILVSSSRDEIVNAIRRLKSDEQPSLAEREDLVGLRKDRKESMLFAYIGGDSIRQVMRHAVHGEEAMVANVMLDPNSLSHFKATVKVVNEQVEVAASLKYDEGHRAVAYGLMRTEPIEGRAFRFLPQDAAVIAALGMNPFIESMTPTSRDSEVFSLLDVGREIFANITELNVFVLPPNNPGAPMPDFGLVLSVSDGDKSTELWGQMLSLPAEAGAPGVTVKNVTISGRKAKQFQFPDAPPFTMSRLDEKNIVLGTDAAVKAAFEAGEDDREDVRAKIGSPSDANKLIFVNVAQAMELAAKMEPGDADEIRQAKMAVEDLNVSLSTSEEPNELVVRLVARDLPNLRRVAEHFADQMRSPSDR